MPRSPSSAPLPKWPTSPSPGAGPIGAVTGVVAGATKGFAVAGPIGGVIGGFVGGVLGLVGKKAPYVWPESQADFEGQALARYERKLDNALRSGQTARMRQQARGAYLAQISAGELHYGGALDSVSDVETGAALDSAAAWYPAASYYPIMADFPAPTRRRRRRRVKRKRKARR